MFCPPRLFRTLLVLVSLPTAAFVATCVIWLAVIAVAVAYSGSNGMPDISIVVNSATAFAAGALAAAWLMAMFMAMSRMAQLVALPIVLSGFIGGLAGLFVPPVTKLLLSITPLAFSLIHTVFPYK